MKQIELRQDNLILPNSIFVLMWSVVFSLVILFYFSFGIFSVCFQSRGNQIFSDVRNTILVMFICILNSIIFVNIGVVMKGKLVRNRKKNIEKYLKSPLFALDCIVLVFLFARLILELVGQDKSNLLSLLDLIVIIKFSNIRTYDNIMKNYYFNQWSLLIYKFFKYVLILAFLCHIVGCIYFLIDSALIQAQWYPLPQHWLISAQAMPGLYYETVGMQYLYSFYVSIVTLSTIAYGDILPLNQTQVAYILLIVTFLLMFYVYIFTQISIILEWFNRKAIRIYEKRHRLARYLKKLKISRILSSKIVNEFEYREKISNKTNKGLFYNDLSSKVGKKYSATHYKYLEHKFLPRFIKNLNVDVTLFNEAISQSFFTPEQYFSSVQFYNSKYYDRKMFFISRHKVFRFLKFGRSSLVEIAQSQRWLGINTFLTGQNDIHQFWRVEVPIQLTTVSYQSFLIALKETKSLAYEKFMEQVHKTILSGGSSEDFNKCMLCWKGYHSSQYCTIYKPTNFYLVRKQSRFSELKKIITSIEVNFRKKSARNYGKQKKVLNIKLDYDSKENSKQTQTDMKQLALLNGKNINRYHWQEVVKLWHLYMPTENIEGNRYKFRRIVRIVEE